MFCEKCGNSLNNQNKCQKCEFQKSNQKMSVLLFLGIFFFPLIFCWFTLKKGYSKISRFLSFGWALFTVFFSIISLTAISSATNKLAEVSQTLNHEEVLISQNNSNHASNSNSSEIIKANPTDIISEYNENEIAADLKYKDKMVEISGRITSIAKDILNKPYITFDSRDEIEFRKVQIYFDKNDQNTLSHLKNGQKITIRGIVSGLMMNVLIHDGEIIEDNT